MKSNSSELGKKKIAEPSKEKTKKSSYELVNMRARMFTSEHRCFVPGYN